MKAGVRILFLGDSLTEYFDWQDRFPAQTVTNAGVSGETVQGLLRRLYAIVSNFEEPDFIFLMTGINNVAMEDYGIIESYEQAVLALQRYFSKAEIVVQSLLPVILSWVENREIVRLNSALKEMAAARHLTYLDVHRNFMDATGRAKASCLLDDGVHLSTEGYRVWSARVEEFLRSRGVLT
jgi:lysophospholipase L1-like esterase